MTLTSASPSVAVGIGQAMGKAPVAGPTSAIERLYAKLRSTGPVVVAFSGGADSSLLAWAAHRALGTNEVLAVTAVSPSLAGSELSDCRELAAEWGLNYREVEAYEALLPGYVANGPDRCWYCKDELMRRLVPVAEEMGGATVALGVNLDDLGDHRPGQAAAAAAGAIFPLVEAGFTKAMVREVSKSLGLRTWDKPAAACLASRLPYGTPVTVGTLATVAKAEAGLRALGFKAMRVRHYGELARVELPTDDLGAVLDKREAVVMAVRAAGYRYVTLDLEGLRSGNLNDVLAVVTPASSPPGSAQEATK